MSSRTIVIAGAGIGGLTAALAVAAKGFRAALFDKAQRLEETGAGIQLSSNATRVLIALGLGEQLKRAAVAPIEIRVKSRRDRNLVRIPLGAATETRYGAPYYIIHRGDLQAVLLEAAQAHPDITIELGCEIDGFAAHANGLTVQFTRQGRVAETHGIALVGADGLWSNVRRKLGDDTPPRYSGRTAWRAVVSPKSVDPEYREPAVNLWLGRNTHLVVYPVKAGAAVNLVAIASDKTPSQGWSTQAGPDEVLSRFSRWFWAEDVRDMLAVPERWLKWPLYDRAPLARWGHGPVTLLGDAAHPMLPFLAQGAAMAIEDAAVLAECIALAPENLDGAFRHYEAVRRPRTAKVQRGARRNDYLYHLAWPESLLRNLSLRAMGGRHLLARYDWIYDWRP